MIWEVATDALFLFFFFFGSLVFGTYFWFRLHQKQKMAEGHGLQEEELKKK